MMQIEGIRGLEALVFSTKGGNTHFTGVFAPYATQTMILSPFWGTGAILYADSATIVNHPSTKVKGLPLNDSPD